VNSSIKTDIDTKVGQIVAATKIGNFKYLLSKVLSNFMILLTIVGVVFIMSIILFFLYNDGFPFEPLQFIKPYLVITVPAMFSIAVIAVLFEVFLGKYSVVQNIVFFFIFTFLMLFTPKTENQFALDIFGSKIVMKQLEENVKTITDESENTNLTIGYVFGNVKNSNRFEFEGVDFSTFFIISRFLWILFGFLILFLIAPFFHRFNVKEYISPKKQLLPVDKPTKMKDISLINLPNFQINYSILPLLKTEFLLLFRKGKKWLWLLNIIGMVLLALLPIKIAHQMVLPIVWFLQVSRLSDLTIKELIHNVHYFAFTSYKPISRLFVSQLISAIILMVFLASPLIIRLGISLNITGLLAVILGAILIVMLASLLGVLSKGKKLFEILFFMITYANINGILYIDYFGAFEHHKLYITHLIILVIITGILSVLIRKYQLES
jgi:hypothetical protein